MRYFGVSYGVVSVAASVSNTLFGGRSEFMTIDNVGLANGGHVLAWSAFYRSPGIQASTTTYSTGGTIFDAVGRSVGSVTGTQVAALANGGIATADFVRIGGSDFVRIERRTDNGSLLGAVDILNQTGFGEGAPAIAALVTGGVVVAWGDRAAGTGDIRFQMFSADGSISGDQRLAHAASATSQNSPAIAALIGGGFVVAWRDDETQNSSPISLIRFQRYDPSGVAVGGVGTANPAYIAALSNPDITELASGGFVITWSVSQDFRGQAFSAEGVPVGAEFGAFGTAGLETDAAVRPLKDGGFIVVWQDNALNAFGEPASSGIFARAYDDAGVPLGPQFMVAPAGSTLPTVTTLTDGTLEFAWLQPTVGPGPGFGSEICTRRIGLDWATDYSGTDGTDVLLGSPIDDTLSPGAGVDQVRGGAGSDTVSYAGAGMAVEVDLASRWSWDGSSMDFFQSIENAIGSAFNDVLTGDGFNNTLDGGSAGTDHLRGGGGRDTVSYASSLTGVSIDLALQVSWDGITMDFLQSIENATGSAFNDVLVGDSGDNVIDGGTGGIDFLFGGGGSDTVSYVSATAGVKIYLSSQVGWDGTSMDSYGSIENATGSRFADWIEGSSGDNLLAGAGGDDRINGGLGTDTLVLSGLRNQYAFTDLGGGLFRSTDSGWARDGVDTFSGIELVRFADGSIISLGDLIAGAASAEAKELAPLVLPPRWAEREDDEAALLPISNPHLETSAMFTLDGAGEIAPNSATRWSNSDWGSW